MKPPVPPTPPFPLGVAHRQPIPQTIMPGMPVGAVIAFAGALLQDKNATAKQKTDLQHYGWRLCDGTELFIKDYPELFEALGFLYGGNGSTTFNLPNFSGQFLRSVDVTGVLNGGAAKREPGPGVGSVQGFALQDHEHDVSIGVGTIIGGDKGGTAVPVGSSQTGKIVQDGKVKVDAAETRPMNIAIYWLIKCCPDPAGGFDRAAAI